MLNLVGSVPAVCNDPSGKVVSMISVTAGHNALSFHHVQEAVASKYVTIFHLPGKYNPANILSKQWAYALVWQTMNALLFARGDTWDLLDDECGEE
jgi:hypothetical protein